jgi:hypothetical protein
MERIRHEFGDLANMLSLIHRNLDRGFVRAIWAGSVVLVHEWRASLAQQPSKSVIASFLAGFIVLGVVSGSAATEPSVSGLWQKIEGETGKPVGWFLFVERNGLYEGVIAKIVSAAWRSQKSDLFKLPG